MPQSLKKTITGLAIATLFSWSAWVLVLYKLDPYSNLKFALPFFFVSFFFALTGFFTLILYYSKRWKAVEGYGIKFLMISLRQGILLSICTTLSLSLLMLGLLRVWNGLLLVAIMMLIEFYMSGRDELN